MNNPLVRFRNARTLVASLVAVVLVGGAATAVVAHRTAQADAVATSASSTSASSVAPTRPQATPHTATRSSNTRDAGRTRIKRVTRPTAAPSGAHVDHRLAVRATDRRSAHTAVSVASPAAAASSPLAGGPWGVYRGPWDGVYPAYTAAHGADKAELAKVALQPRVIWFASNQSSSRIGPNIRSYVSQVQGGDPDTLVQLALFRIFPDSDGSEAGRDHPLSAAEQAAYKTWMNNAANAIGDARAAVVLEPDLALLAPPTRRGAEATADPAVREGLVAWAAKRLSELPRTTVYLDCGDADWLSVPTCARLLGASGIQYARGFALGATHYSDTGGNISYGAELVDALATEGYPGKHFVIDTADNGRGFTWTYWNTHQAKLGGDFDNAAPCASSSEVECDTLGLPPTAKTWDQPALGLTSTQNVQAEHLVDGYLWFGRPWLDDQAAPFDLKRTLQVARSTPYQ